jgi:predicted ATPase
MQYLNVNEIVVAEQPPISYYLAPGTFKVLTLLALLVQQYKY